MITKGTNGKIYKIRPNKESRFETFTDSYGMFGSGLHFTVLGKIKHFRMRNERVMLGERDEGVER